MLWVSNDVIFILGELSLYFNGHNCSLFFSHFSPFFSALKAAHSDLWDERCCAVHGNDSAEKTLQLICCGWSISTNHKSLWLETQLIWYDLKFIKYDIDCASVCVCVCVCVRESECQAYASNGYVTVFAQPFLTVSFNERRTYCN